MPKKLSPLARLRAKKPAPVTEHRRPINHAFVANAAGNLTPEQREAMKREEDLSRHREWQFGYAQSGPYGGKG